jgi:Gp19/Gp15/Gp42-like protein
VSLPAVTITDLEAEYEGDLDDFGFATEWFERKLVVAVDKATSKYGAQMEARLAAGRLTAPTYISVICEAVLRIARNTNGYRSEQEGNYQYEQDVTVAAGKLFFTDENVEDLTGINPRRGTKMGTAVVSPLQGGR